MPPKPAAAAPPKNPPKPPPFTNYQTFILAKEPFSVGDKVSVASGGARWDFVAEIERIHTDAEGEVLIDARWFYRPEETAMGRQPWHGADELLDSDHVDTFHVRCVNSKCVIHSLKDYEKLGQDKADGEVAETPPLPVYYSRSKYLTKQRKLETPLPRYCSCKQPQNPEYALLRCDTCQEWFFGNCVGVSAAEAATLKKWVCPICSPEDEESRKRKSSEELALHEKVRKGECSPWPESAAGNKKRKGGRR